MNKIKCILGSFIIVGACWFPVDAQSILDDLERFEYFFQSNNIENINKAIANAQTKIIDAQVTFDKPAEAVAMKELGLLYLTQTYEYEKAMNYFLEALAFEENNKIEKGKVFTYLAIAKVFEKVEINYKSAEFINKALLQEDVKNNIHLKVYLLIQLGKINILMNELQLATENFEEVLTHKGLFEIKYEAETYFRLGHIEKLKGSFVNSLNIHKKALTLQRKLSDRLSESISLYTIGQLYWAMQNQERALANYKVAIEVQTELNDNAGMAKTYLKVGRLYYDIKKYDRAIANLELALQNALKVNISAVIRDCYLNLSQCYRQQNNYQRALDYQEEFLAMNEFIENDKDEQQLVKIQNRHSVDDFQAKISKLDEDRLKKEQELVEQLAFRKNLVILTTFILVVAVLLLILYFVKLQSNKKLTIINKKVAKQNDELHDLNATKDKFFSIISHDLKGPLNSLSSFTYLLTDHIESMSKEEIQNLAKDLDKSQKNLYALLENLLEWSQSQTGKIEFTPSNFDIVELINENKELLMAQAENKNIDLIANTPVEEESVFANKNAINTVIRNLISNAIKFTPAEGSITLYLNKLESEIIVSVKDTGIGMNKAVMDKLFRIDTKYSTKGTADEKGTGLGLILCKEFIEKCGGSIWVQSKIDKGSTFSFSIPLQS